MFKRQSARDDFTAGVSFSLLSTNLRPFLLNPRVELILLLGQFFKLLLWRFAVWHVV